jgi:hypothetical protein
MILYDYKLLHCIFNRPKESLISGVSDNPDKALLFDFPVDAPSLVVRRIRFLATSSHAGRQALNIRPIQTGRNES